MQQKNIAVVGCGHWGQNHVRNFSELGALGAICDPDKNTAERIGEKFGVVALSYEEVIMDHSYQGVVLAVPAPLHAEMAIRALEAGKHVFVEKPLAMNKLQAEEMISAASENDRSLMVGHLLQYHPVFDRLATLLASGDLGRIKHIKSNRLSFGKVRLEEDVISYMSIH